MAANLRDDEERFKRIIMIGEYIMETGDSTRKTAKFFTEKYFPISNATVSDYLSRYKEMISNPDKKKEIEEIIKNNTASSVDDEDIKKRVLSVISLYKQGYTMEEISDILYITYWTIYRDITVRYKLINEEDYYNSILTILKNNKESNLNRKK